jgi:hypothetical protein
MKGTWLPTLCFFFKTLVMLGALLAPVSRLSTFIARCIALEVFVIKLTFASLLIGQRRLTVDPALCRDMRAPTDSRRLSWCISPTAVGSVNRRGNVSSTTCRCVNRSSRSYVARRCVSDVASAGNTTRSVG